MLRFFRNTHLFLGITVFLFVLMYGLSAVQMAHSAWFDMKPAVTEMRLTIAPDITDDPRAIAAELRRAGLRGEARDAQATADGYAIFLERPGAACQIHYTRATREAKVRIRTTGFMGMLNRIHRNSSTPRTIGAAVETEQVLLVGGSEWPRRGSPECYAFAEGRFA